MNKKASILRLAEEASKVQEQAVRILHQASEKGQASRVASRWVEKQGGKTITIPTTNGSQEVPVIASIGSWAVHKTINASTWSVTFVPLGLKALDAKTLKQALGVLAAFEGVPELLNAQNKTQVEPYKDLIIQIARQNAPDIRLRVYYIERMLIAGGLWKQGDRYGKAGEFWGLEGSSRMISVGKRDLLRNIFYVERKNGGRPGDMNTRWILEDSELLSKVSEETIQKWIKWAKAGLSTKELREAVRYGKRPTASGALDRL